MISRKKVANLCRRFIRKSLVICCGFVPPIVIGGLLVSTRVGCNVIVNGKVIGTAPSEEYVDEIISDINREFSACTPEDNTTLIKAETKPKLLIGEEFSSKEKLTDALKDTSPNLKKAYSIKSNGKTVAAFETEDEMKKCYQEFVSTMTKDSQEYKILDEISFEYDNVPHSMIESAHNGEKMLSGTYEYSNVVNVDKTTKKSDILTDFCITEREFEKLNPNYVQGQTSRVVIQSEIPYIRILTVNTDVKEEVLKHKTEYKKDPTMLVGETRVDAQGADGKREATESTHCINGRFVCKKIINETIQKPKTEVLVVGTKKPVKGESTGKFVSPYAGVLTSPYGYRWGRMHSGVDIGGSEGADIVASDGGVVTFAGWNNGGYGYMVKIDHGNGYSTLYAHCSKVYVSSGQKVCQGDTISALGNTGRSTGPHLHFEIINNSTGKTEDPLGHFKVN